MNKKYIDLHIHSIYSDGDKTPIEILKMAEKLGLSDISITDHENCKAYEELEKIKIKNIYHGNLISGCELMTSFDNTIIEILGYQVDTKIINKWYDKRYSKEEIDKRDRQLFVRLMQKINQINLYLEKPMYLPDEIPYSGYFKYMTYQALSSYRQNDDYFKKYKISSYEEFNRKALSDPRSPLFIKESDYIATMQEVIDLIHKAGGLAFVAHLYKYPVSNHIAFLSKIIEETKEIDGVECYYSSFSKEQTQKLDEFCNIHKLFQSGGSDYHGKLKPNINMGEGSEKIKIEKEIINKWSKNIDRGEENERRE